MYDRPSEGREFNEAEDANKEYVGCEPGIAYRFDAAASDRELSVQEIENIVDSLDAHLVRERSRLFQEIQPNYEGVNAARVQDYANSLGLDTRPHIVMDAHEIEKVGQVLNSSVGNNFVQDAKSALEKGDSYGEYLPSYHVSLVVRSPTSPDHFIERILMHEQTHSGAKTVTSFSVGDNQVEYTTANFGVEKINGDEQLGLFWEEARAELVAASYHQKHYPELINPDIPKDNIPSKYTYDGIHMSYTAFAAVGSEFLVIEDPRILSCLLDAATDEAAAAELRGRVNGLVPGLYDDIESSVTGLGREPLEDGMYKIIKGLYHKGGLPIPCSPRDIPFMARTQELFERKIRQVHAARGL